MKEFEKHSVKALKADKDGEPIPSAVFLPPALQQGKVRAVHAFETALPDIQANIARIQNECDPVGLMIAIAMGMPVATHTIDADGKLVTKYETLPLNNPIRDRMIRHLADKVLPRISVKQTKTTKKDDTTDEWEATIGNAAERSED